MGNLRNYSMDAFPDPIHCHPPMDAAVRIREPGRWDRNLRLYAAMRLYTPMPRRSLYRQMKVPELSLIHI